MRAIISLLVAVLLVGCTEIQTSGPVQEVPLGSEQLGVQIIAKPPQPGVTAVRLVEGFVQAMAEPEADYAVARQYLTPEMTQLWDPRNGGSVYRGVVADEEGAVLVRGVRTGELDPVGRFTATSDELSHDFGVVEVDGEWRIGAPPEGVLVADYIFERYWSHVTIYFGSADGKHLVPDLIHVPDALLTPGRIVEALVAGPSDALKPAVINAMGEGVALATQGASMNDVGTVKVALTRLNENMPDARRALLGAQLLWSLTAMPRVTGLRITDDGDPFSLPDQNADLVVALASQERFQLLSRTATTDLFGVRDGVGVRIDAGGKVLPMSSGDAKVSEVAVSVDGTLVGFIDEARQAVYVGPLGGELVPVSPGRLNLRSAQFALGDLWLIGDDSTGSTHLLRVNEQGKVTEVDVGEISGNLVDFSITQAGVRMAAVVEQGDVRTLMMSSVVEGARPRLTSVASLPILGGIRSPLKGFRSLDWGGETELVVIAEAQSGPSIHRSRMDGSLVEDLGPLSDEPVQVSALPDSGGSAVVMRTADDKVLRYDANNRWTRVDEMLQDVSYPG